VRPMIASVYFEPGPDSTRKPHANTLPSLKRRMSTAPRSLYSGVPGLRPGGFPPALQQSYRCRLARSRPSHPDMNYISPDTLKNDPLDQKILNRARSLAPWLRVVSFRMTVLVIKRDIMPGCSLCLSCRKRATHSDPICMVRD